MMQDSAIATVSLDGGMSVRLVGGESPVRLLEVKPAYHTLPTRQRLYALREVQTWLSREVEKINKEIGNGPQES